MFNRGLDIHYYLTECWLHEVRGYFKIFLNCVCVLSPHLTVLLDTVYNNCNWLPVSPPWKVESLCWKGLFLQNLCNILWIYSRRGCVFHQPLWIRKVQKLLFQRLLNLKLFVASIVEKDSIYMHISSISIFLKGGSNSGNNNDNNN